MENKIPQPVPDYIEPGLKILFVGFNPSLRSGEVGHHFASPNNRFWRIIHKRVCSSLQQRPGTHENRRYCSYLQNTGSIY